MKPKRSYKQKPERELRAAKEKIVSLFVKADNYFLEGKKDLANKYVKKARRKAMSVKINLNRYNNYKNKFCKHCYSYIKLGVNAKRRVKNKIQLTTCLECGKVSRKPLRK